MKRNTLKLVTLSFAVLVSAATADVVLVSSAEQVGLLELYTSEGCSSCPPADRWIANLKNDAGLWQKFVPLSFHVDYWDYIGWKDRFASSRYSQRQRRHADQGAVRTAYTPGFVYNGREWRGWFGRRTTDFPQADRAGVLRASAIGNQVEVRFQPVQTAARDLQVTVALIGFGLTTNVRAGENKGRVLSHDFVVLGLNEAPLSRNNDEFGAVLALPQNEINAERYALAVWVSSVDRQTPLQAAGGWLPPQQ